MFGLITKNKCTGCAACQYICPIQCIQMVYDKEGFLYPQATSECIQCGLCTKICPQNNDANINNIYSGTEKRVFCALTKDKDVWLNSTSGGAFSEITNCWGDDDTYVFGASWEKDQRHVSHIGVKKDDISILRKSKYIQSRINDTYKLIKELLENNQYIVFCGTPCQVAGLRAVLHKQYDKLLLIDLVCHGVGSQFVFDSSISVMEKMLGGEIDKYEFRSKRGPYETDYMSKIVLKNGKIIYLKKDPFIQLYLAQKCLRPSCGEACIYRNQNRQGDITIADFKGLTKVFPRLSGTKYNYSTIEINSEKGYSIISDLKKRMNLIPCELSTICQYNPLLFSHVKYKTDRNRFFDQFLYNKNEAIHNNTEPCELYKMSIKRKIYNLLPMTIRKVIKR